jgi:hypothetical protein
MEIGIINSQTMEKNGGRSMKKMVALIAGALLAMPMMAVAADGIVGDCSDCHTMHNSQQGAAVAKVGAGATLSTDPIQNLLKFDCIACHANPTATGKLWTLPGGSVVPQVSQSTDDNLAGGNFRYSSTSDRKGHNVKDLTPADGSNSDGVYDTPPGFYHASTHGPKFRTNYGVASLGAAGAAYGEFTCAGARGCHGTRSQLLSGATVDNGTANVYVPVYRTGIAAISGAHHNSFDGIKNPAQNTQAVSNGATVAAGYRFIPGLKGVGNEVDRWQNVDANSHNEYYGVAGGISTALGTGCAYCHIEGTAGTGLSARATFNSTLAVPNQSMSGFCTTCHGEFHSSAANDLEGVAANGVSGAFLRHPSDYVLPGGTTEYAAYTTYDITAPVARPSLIASSATVTPTQDMVMCLSCHAAHATENDFMLRFAYTYDGSGTMQAGAYGDIASAQGAGGCLACHTTKGVLPANR